MQLETVESTVLSIRNILLSKHCRWSWSICDPAVKTQSWFWVLPLVKQ